MFQRLLPAIGLVVALACITWGSPTPPNCTPRPSTVTIGSHTLRVDVAADEASREQGLMGVTDLPVDRGMVFLLDGRPRARSG